MHTITRLTARYSYLLIALLPMLIVGSSVLLTSRETVGEWERNKIIKFSHQFHINTVGVGCADCHDAAATSRLSSDNLLSKKANCQSCHEEQLDSNCTYCHTSEDPSDYLALTTAPRTIIFSHEQHLKEQDVSCESCHKGLDKMDYAGPSTLPPMETCNTCHDAAKASNQCESCHTDLAALRPVAHNRTNFLREHKRIVRLDDRSCAGCHTHDACQDCHAAAGLLATVASGRDLSTPISPRLFGIDRGQTSALTKVHDLNFRFTHGIAVKAKASNCATCHSTREFCSECHAAGGHVNQLKFKPDSHQQPRFKTIGAGSGGGLHAELARRDIETCAACHDAQGADPTCVTCHTDADGIRRTDAKTHARGFMSSVRGEWHSDPGASCYICHTDANARPQGIKGIGFCSYCHK
ncbi:MAG: cytochrome c3 family protein [Ignavibacteria bacterium]|nr:cytochrome c3 family protein [Ignavibacteria bacterium]